MNNSIPVVIAVIAAVALSFLGPSQTIVGVVIFIAASLNHLRTPALDIAEIDDRLKAKIRAQFSEYRKNLVQLNQRLLAVESRQTGNDPFGG